MVPGHPTMMFVEFWRFGLFIGCFRAFHHCLPAHSCSFSLSWCPKSSPAVPLCCHLGDTNRDLGGTNPFLCLVSVGPFLVLLTHFLWCWQRGLQTFGAMLGLCHPADLFQPKSFQDFKQQFAKFGVFFLVPAPADQGICCQGVLVLLWCRNYCWEELLPPRSFQQCGAFHAHFVELCF